MNEIKSVLGDIEVDVQELKSRLLAQMTTIPRFSWNVTQQQAEDMLTAAYIAEVEHRRMVYIRNAEMQKIIGFVADYLTEENKKLGLLMCGTCGNGKTTMLYAIRAITQRLDAQEQGKKFFGIRIIDAKEIIELFKDQEAFRKLTNDWCVAIDDLGREATEVMSYGNISNPVIDMLEHRYKMQLPTLITTNLTPKEIRDKYGNRIADRFNEMFRVVTFGNTTYRR